MKNLLLSDVEYLTDLDAILEISFNGTNLSKQPRYLIEIECKDGFALRHSYNFIKSETSRGKRFADHPLDVIALTLDDAPVETIEKTLAGIPHSIIPIPNANAQTIIKALEKNGVDDTRLALYLEIFTEKEKIPFQDYLELNSQYGMIQFQAHTLESGVINTYRDELTKKVPSKTLDCTAENYLLEAAGHGWLPKTGTSFHYPKSKPYSLTTLNHFVSGSLKIRKAEESDLAELSKIEESCWQKPFRKLQTRLSQRIKDYPEGQLVMQNKEGKIIGSLYSQKIANIDALNDAQADTLHMLQDGNGSVVQLIALNLLPEKGITDVEDRFLEFFLQKALTANRITHVAAVLRCQNYPGPEVISMESYVKELKQEMGSADLATRIHAQHGADIIKCIPEYRPMDEKNKGYGVLITYSRKSRKPKIVSAKKTAILSFEEEYTPESITATVETIIKRLLKNKGKYSPSDKFLDMGLESIQLLELRALFTDEFSLDLAPNFFIQYETPQEIIDFFIESKLQPYREWLYEYKWETSQIPPSKILEPNKIWIIFADDNEEYATSIRGFLREHQQKCFTILKGTNFKKQSDEIISIDPSSSEHYEKLFALLPDREQLAGVIYFWGIKDDGDEFTGPSLEELNSFHQFSIESLMLLANCMAALKLACSPKLWVVTRSMIKDGTTESLSEWPLNGLCKIIREEYQKFQCTFVALDNRESPAESCETLFGEIRGSTNEPQIAYTKGQRIIPRMIQSEVEAVRLPTFSPRATYLIAGGFRALGVLLARWYASNGAKHIVLVDEIEMTSEIKNFINELILEGIDILTFKIDVDNPAELEKILNQIENELPPLKGIIHAAGLVDNDLLLHMDWERFKAIHRLKVSFSWNLHNLTEQMDLDHFILFSSCLPDLTPLGKANHATGNSFLDVLSHFRKKRGLPSLTIDWGPWELRHMEVLKLVEKSLSDRVKMHRLDEGKQV